MGSLVLRECFLGQWVAERNRDGLGAKAESSFRKDPRESCEGSWGCSCKRVSCRLVVVPHKGGAVSAALFVGGPRKWRFMSILYF